MPLIIKGTDTDFTPAPPGLHQAVCCDVVDLGVVEGKFGPKRKLKIVWQLESRNEKGERFQVRASYTQSLAEKSNLRHALEAWRGRPFSQEELRAFDVERLIGANCQMQVAHRVSQSTGRTYANPMALLPLAKGMKKMTPENYEREPWPVGDDDIITDASTDPPADDSFGEQPPF